MFSFNIFVYMHNR